MKANIILLFVLLASGFLYGQTPSERKTVFIIVDGIAPDVIERLQPPAITSIAKTGGYQRAIMGGEKGRYNETPTISAVGYNSLITGTWVYKHNVYGNDISAPNYNYYTLFRFFKEAYPNKKTAIFSTWLDNRTKLIGEGLEATGNLKIDYSFDGLELDTINYPHDPHSNYIHKIDEAVTAEAVKQIKNNAPDLSWVYLQYTDDIGHRIGDSKQMDSAVMIADSQIGRIYEAINYRKENFNEDWLIIVTTDHGRDAATGRHHGGQSIREKAIWILTNAQGLNNYYFSGNPKMVDILPTIIRFMNIPIPSENEAELDGVALTGKVSIGNPDAFINEKGELAITWESFDTEGDVKISIAQTNHFKTGGNDEYRVLGETKLSARKFTIPIKIEKGKTYKLLLEGKYNTVNRWF